MPHKPVVKRDGTTTKVRMVFDTSMKPRPVANSVNDCMFTGPPLQPLLWDILIRARVAPSIALVDIQKAFLQVGVKEDDRDAFRFLFNIDLKEEHLRVPFGAEACPFILGATVQNHLNQQPVEYESTVDALRENTYVDNVMKTGDGLTELEKFKQEATKIFESGMFPLHKWESDVETLESEGMPNPSKILGLK